MAPRSPVPSALLALLALASCAAPRASLIPGPASPSATIAPVEPSAPQPVAAEPHARGTEPTPPAPAPPAPLRFAAHRLAAHFGRASAYDAEGWLVLVTPGALAVFEDPRSDTPTRTLRNPFRRHEDQREVPWMAPVGAHAVLGHDGRNAVLLDLATGRVRWRSPLAPRRAVAPFAEASSAATVGAVLATEPEPGAHPARDGGVPYLLVYAAFDRATGAPRWSEATDTTCADRASPRVYTSRFVRGVQRVELRELDTGRVRWFIDAPTYRASLYSCDGDALFMQRGPVLTRATSQGEVRWDQPIGHSSVESLVRAGDSACFAAYGGSGDGALRVECRGAADGALRWQRAVARRGAMPEVPLRAVRDRVILVGADGVLRVLDAATGVERWHWGLGAMSRVAVADEGRVLVTTDALGRAWRFTETDDPREESPAERARLAITLEPGAGFEPLRGPVLVNGVPVAVPEGAEAQRAPIEATVATRGVLEVFAFGDSTVDGVYEGRTRVPLDGRRGAYPVRLRLREVMGTGE